MWTSAPRFARIAFTLALAGMLIPADGADVKPDKKKSQAAYQRGQKADEASLRDQALADLEQAAKLDPNNAETAQLLTHAKARVAAKIQEARARYSRTSLGSRRMASP